MEQITIFTDGSSRGNPGPGGWGAVLISPDGRVVELGGREDVTTNNRMELAAVRGALEYIESKKIEGDIAVHSDSAYVLNGVTGWMYGWEKNGWKTKTGDPVLNQDLWQDIGASVYRLKSKRTLLWNKVSGHSGHRGNDRVDAIATAFADKEPFPLFRGALDMYEQSLGGSLLETDADAVTNTKKKTSKKKTGPAYSYVSSVGGVVTVDETWAACEARVKGKKGVRYQKVFSQQEEASLIREWQK